MASLRDNSQMARAFASLVGRAGSGDLSERVRQNGAPHGGTESSTFVTASVPSEHRVASVCVKREHIVTLHHRPFHAWGSRWHSGNRDADDARRFLQQALHVRGRHVSLYHVTVHECCMTGGSERRHTMRALQPLDFRARCVNRDDTEGVGAQVINPPAATTARRRLVNRHDSAGRGIPDSRQPHCVAGKVGFPGAAGRRNDGGQCKARHQPGIARRTMHRLFPVNGSARKVARTSHRGFLKVFESPAPWSRPDMCEQRLTVPTIRQTPGIIPRRRARSRSR